MKSKLMKRSVHIFAMVIMLTQLFVPIIPAWQALARADELYISTDFTYSADEDTVEGFSAAGSLKYTSNSDHKLNIPTKSDDEQTDITSIGRHAFQNLTLETVDLPATIQSIQDYAFDRNAIKTVNFTELANLTTIGEAAFRANQLKTVKLTSALTSIGSSAFANNDLTSVEGANVAQLTSVQTVSDSAFDGNKLTEIAFGDALTTIGNDAFKGNGQIVKVTTTSAQAIPSRYTQGDGFVVNPLSINVDYVDHKGALLEKTTLGNNFATGTKFYLKGDTFTKAEIDGLSKDIAGYTYLETSPADGFELTSSTSITVRYVKNDAIPTLSASNLYYLTDPEEVITEAMVKSRISAKTAGGVTIPADNITISVENGTFPLSRENDYTYHIHVRVVDNLGNPATTNIDVEVFTALADQEIGNGWYYRDFKYYGTYLAGFSQSGVDKLLAGNGDLVFPGVNPETKNPLTVVGNVNIEGAFSFNTAEYRPLMISMNFEQMTGLASIEESAFSNLINLERLSFRGLRNLTGLPGRGYGTPFEASPKLTQLDMTGCTAFTTFGRSCFANSPITKLTGLESLTNLKTIDESTFQKATFTEGFDFRLLPKLAIIGNNAFSDSQMPVVDLTQCTNLYSLGGSYAYGGGIFRNNKAVTRVDMSGLTKLTNISQAMFVSSTKLTSVNISNMPLLDTIGDGAFQNSVLTELNWSNLPKLKNIGQYAFYSLPIEELDLTTFPLLTTIGVRAFGNNTKLKRVDLSNLDKLTTINSGAFMYAPLESLNLTNCSNLTSINNNAFEKAILEQIAGIETVTKLTTLSDYAFYWSPFTAGFDFHLFPNLKTIGNYAFYSAKFTELDLSNLKALTGIGENAFGNAVNLEKVDLSGANLMNFTGGSVFRYAPIVDLDMTGCTGVKTFTNNIFEKAKLETITGLADLSAVTSINNYAFMNSPFTNGFNFQAFPNLTYIGIQAFLNAKFQEVDLSNLTKLTTIVEGAFNNATNLTKVNLRGERALTSIGASAFLNAPIEDLDVTGCLNLTTIGNSAFNKAAGLTHITGISDLSKLNSIGRSAFYASPLDDRFDFRYFPNLTYIGYTAFYNAKFTVVDFSNSTKISNIEDNNVFGNVLTLKKVSFNGCSALTTITNGTFYNAPIEELDLTGTKLTNIGTNAFRLAKLKTIQGFDSLATLKTIGDGAFYSSPLEELDFTGVTELTTIGQAAFYSAKLTSLDLSNQQKLIQITKEAFYNSPLEWVKIGAINPTQGTATTKNLYNVAGIPTGYRISSKNIDVPVYIKGPAPSTILGGVNWGYHVIYDEIPVSYFDKDNNQIARNSTLDAYNGLVVTPPQIYGYQREATTVEHNVPGSDDKATGTVTLTNPGNLPDYKAAGLKFYYTPLADSVLAPYNGNELFFTPIKTVGRLDQKMSTKLTLSTKMKNAGLTNFKGTIEVHYDATLIDPNSFTFTQESQYYTVANPADTPGVLKFVFTETYNNIVEGSTSMLAPTISFKLRNDGTVPYNAPIVMEAYLMDGTLMANKADEITIKGIYNHSNLEKTDNLYEHSINRGGLDELGLFKDTSDLAINYSFKFPLERNIESYELIDKLPTYQAYQVDETGAPVVNDGVVQVETLRPHLSAASIALGWHYTDDAGNPIEANLDGTPTDTVNATHVRRSRGDGDSQKLNTKDINAGVLTLIYPHVTPTGNANIHNTAEISAVPVDTNGKFDEISQSLDGEAYTEPVMTSEATVSTKVYSYESSNPTPTPAPSTTNLYVNNYATFSGTNTNQAPGYRDNYLYDTTGDKAREQKWRMPVTVQDSTNTVQLESVTLKHELTTNAIGVLKYTKVDASDFAQPIITAYSADGTTELYVSNGDKVIEFPASIQAEIRYITITDPTISVKNTSISKTAVISTAMIAPAATHYQTPMLAKDNQFYTKASMSAVSVLPATAGTVYNQKQTVEDYYEIREPKVGVQVTDQLIDKVGGSAISTRDTHEVFKYDSVFYRVGMNVIDENTNKILTDAYLLDGATFHNVKVTIEMPKAINPLEFVKDNTLIQGTTNLAVKFTSTANKNKIILTADTLNPKVVKLFGDVKATVGIYANNQTTYDQQVYMEFDDEDNVATQASQGATEDDFTIDRIDTNADQTTLNPDYPENALHAAKSIFVYATEGLSISKFVQTQTASGDETPLNNDDQATLVHGGGLLKYTLAIANITTADQELPTFVDVLPYANDREITSPTSRGTSALNGSQVKLTGPIELTNDDYNVEYLVSQTNIDYHVQGASVTADEYFDPSNDYKLGSLIEIEPPHWVTAAQLDFNYNPLTSGGLEDASKVRAIRVTPKSTATKLIGGAFIEATVSMQAPEYLPTLLGAKIANSFAYKNAETADRFVESNAAKAEIEAPAAALTIKKVDSRDQHAMAGVSFGLYDTANKLLQQKTTDANGLATFTDLSKTNYKLKEMATPSGYKPDTEFKAVSADVFDTLTDGVFTNSTPFVITNEENARIGDVRIHNIDAADHNIANVEFSLVGNGINTTSAPTNNGNILFSGLPVGLYTVTQRKTSVLGKLLAVDTFQIEIKDDNSIETGGVGATYVEVHTNQPNNVYMQEEADDTFSKKVVEVKNDTVPIEAYKGGTSNEARFDTPVWDSGWSTSTLKPLSGARFALYTYDPTAEELGTEWINRTVTNVTTSGGQTTLGDLKANAIYKLVEIQTPINYVGPTNLEDDVEMEKFTTYFKLNDRGEMLYLDGVTDPAPKTNTWSNKVAVKNNAAEQTSSLHIQDVDVQDEDLKLEGIEYTLEKEVSTNVWDLVKNGEDDAFATDDHGEINVSDLTFGNYRIRQTKTITSYLITEFERTFTVEKYIPDQSKSYLVKNQSLEPKIIKGDYVGTYQKNDTIENAQLLALEATLTSQGLYPQRTVESDGRIKLMAGLPNSIYKVVEERGENEHIWAIMSDVTGQVNLTDAVDYTNLMPILADGRVTAAAFAYLPKHTLACQEDATYTLTEVQSPLHYKLNTTPYVYTPALERQAINRNYGKWIGLEDVATLHNLYISTNEILRKNNAFQRLGGVTFELVNENGRSYGTSTTSSEGLLSYLNIPTGVYYLVQIQGSASVKPTPNQAYKINFNGRNDVDAATIGVTPADTLDEENEPWYENACAHLVTTDGDAQINVDYEGFSRLEVISQNKQGGTIAGDVYELTTPGGTTQRYTTNEDGQTTIGGLLKQATPYKLELVQRSGGRVLPIEQADRTWYFNETTVGAGAEMVYCDSTGEPLVAPTDKVEFIPNLPSNESKGALARFTNIMPGNTAEYTVTIPETINTSVSDFTQPDSTVVSNVVADVKYFGENNLKLQISTGDNVDVIQQNTNPIAQHLTFNTTTLFGDANVVILGDNPDDTLYQNVPIALQRPLGTPRWSDKYSGNLTFNIAAVPK
ncbi:MAG: leucine-rich repeat protein [Lactobacillaceae bacterium]|jgi:hypothetical protein|nr:leucine-rich repeat protein [Lactobacillaceae bacterium]